MQNTMIDFFAGVGGFTLGCGAAGFLCIGHCEIDRYAQRSYTAIHGVKKGTWFANDITAVRPEDVPKCDLITAGFPCQDISVCGRGAGLRGARSSLFFEIIRIIQGKHPEDRPRWVVLENVKNLLSINGGKDFTTVLHSLAESGYDVEYQILNSKNFGVPQNRERVFIIGHIGAGGSGKIFPILGADSKNLIQLIGGRQGSRVYDPAGIGITLTAQGGGKGGQTGLYAVSYNRKDGIGKPLDAAHTLTASDYRGINRNQPQNAVFVDLSNHDAKVTDAARCLMGKYTAGMTNHPGVNSGVLVKTRDGESYRIRRLTPRECWRLQGIHDGLFERAATVNSDTQLYRQAGNGVTVNVVYEIARRLLEMEVQVK